MSIVKQGLDCLTRFLSSRTQNLRSSLCRTSDALAAVAPPVLYWASKRSNTYAIRACLQFATKSLEDAAFMPLAIEAAGVAEAWATRVGIPPREADGARPTATIVGAS